MQDKSYGKVGCDHFNRVGFGPFEEELVVTANVDPSPNYPQRRIYLGATRPDGLEPLRDIGGFSLTIQEARQLAQMLTLAARDAEHACPSHSIEVA